VVCLWFCERCGYKMRPSRIERLRRLGFLCV
jgi:C4-type Zn-finger protein